MKPGDDTEQALNDAQDEQAKTGQAYIWCTMQDDKVRPEHVVREGVTFTYDNPPPDGNPGDPNNCRCWPKDVPTDAIKPVYPELFLLPFLGRSFWRIWNLGKEVEWPFGKYKSQQRWQNQLRNRNWTPEQITDTIKNGTKHPAPNKVNPGNPAIRYDYKGRFVVRDETTKEIIQISGAGRFKPNL